MLDELGWEQFLSWQAYESLEPFGDHRSDWNAASVCAAIMNAMAMSVRSRKRWRVKDFLLEFTDEEKKVPADTQPQGTPWQVMKMFAKMSAAIANADEEKRKAREARKTKRVTERAPKKPSTERVEAIRAALQLKKR